MPSKKGINQALIWLRSKAHDENTLDSINAELCINVIMDLQRQYDRLGAQFSNLKNSKKDTDDKKACAEQLSFID